MSSPDTGAAAVPRLVADIGGTNARFALVGDDGEPYAERVFAVDDHSDIVSVIGAYRRAVQAPSLRLAALAVATPVTGDYIGFTNNERWSFSIEATRQSLGLDTLIVLNDFTALALAIPALASGDVWPIGGGTPAPEAAIGLIGPGTGLGVSGLVWSGQRWVPLRTEGGHATFAPADEREWAIARRVQRRFGHVSLERLLSGPGLTNMYQALAEVEGWSPEELGPAAITERALTATCPHCTQTVELFCAILGGAAGNLALTLGARGGVYIGGGIVPRLGDFLARSAFRARFEDKGRFRDYLAAIPTWVITAAHPALRGVARAFELRA